MRKNEIYDRLCASCGEDISLYEDWCKIIEKCSDVLELLDEIFQDTNSNSSKERSMLEEIRLGFKNGLKIKQIKEFARVGYNPDQMQVIRTAYEDGLKENQVKVLANPEFRYKQMDIIRLGFKRGLSIKKVKLYARKEFTSEQMERIADGLEFGLKSNQVAIFAKTVFTQEQMYQIARGLMRVKKGSSRWSEEAVMLYAKPEIGSQKMTAITQMIDCEKIPFEKVQEYSLGEYNYVQLNTIANGYEEGFVQSKIDLYASERFDMYQMAAIFESVKQELPDEAINYIADPSISASTMNAIRECVSQGGDIKVVKSILTDRIMIGPYFEPEYHFGNLKVKIICAAIRDGIDEKFIESIKFYDSNAMQLIIEAKTVKKYGEDKLNIMTASNFSGEQMTEIVKGFDSGLKVKKVKKYAVISFTAEKMIGIRMALEANVNDKIIELLISNNFDAKQSQVICRAYQEGVSLSRIRKIADTDRAASIMENHFKKAVYEKKKVKLATAKARMFDLIVKTE